MAELRQVKLVMSDGEVETADALARLRGCDNRQAYLRRLLAEDAQRCASELRRLSWEEAREDTLAEAPPRPLASPAQAPEGD